MKNLLVASFFSFIILSGLLTFQPVFAVPPVGDSPVQQQTIQDMNFGGAVLAPTYQEHLAVIQNFQKTGSVDSKVFDQSQLANLINSGSFAIAPAQVNANGSVSMIKGGAIGFLASGIQAMTETRPASSIDYIAWMGSKIHVPGSPDVAYAAEGGLGFNSLTPVLQLWTLMRNLAYVIFAILFVVIGVMIMTRQKIDPKTVASIQNALPKIIFSLILVTFSYAIAGFMIDLMFVALGLIVAIFSGVDVGAGQDIKNLLNGSIFGFVFSGSLWGSVGSVASSVGWIVDGMLNFTNSQGGGNIFGLITSGLAFLIVAIAILVALFKTWLALIGAYANIILGIIFAPLRLMMDAIPGQNQFSSWLKDMLVNLLAFPVVTVMLAVGAAIATNFGKWAVTSSINSTAAGSGFVPPLIGTGSQQAAQAFVGLGILLTIPKALDILREALKAPAFKYGSAWMESVKMGAGWTAAGAGPAASTAANLALGKEADRRRMIEKEHAEWMATEGKKGSESKPPSLRTWKGIKGQLGVIVGATGQKK